LAAAPRHPKQIEPPGLMEAADCPESSGVDFPVAVLERRRLAWPCRSRCGLRWPAREPWPSSLCSRPSPPPFSGSPRPYEPSLHRCCACLTAAIRGGRPPAVTTVLVRRLW